MQLTSLEMFFDSNQEVILGEVFFPSTYSRKCVELNHTANIEVANAFHLKHTALYLKHTAENVEMYMYMYTCTLDQNLHVLIGMERL